MLGFFLIDEFILLSDDWKLLCCVCLRVIYSVHQSSFLNHQYQLEAPTCLGADDIHINIVFAVQVAAEEVFRAASPR